MPDGPISLDPLTAILNGGSDDVPFGFVGTTSRVKVGLLINEINNLQEMVALGDYTFEFITPVLTVPTGACSPLNFYHIEIADIAIVIGQLSPYNSDDPITVTIPNTIFSAITYASATFNALEPTEDFGIEITGLDTFVVNRPDALIGNTNVSLLMLGTHL